MIDSNSGLKIQPWFNSAKLASLELPDGWFGRPFDNLHTLTYFSIRPHKTIIELDNQLLLSFTDLASVIVNDKQLELSGFTQLVFDWQEYGNLKAHAQVYTEGLVRFWPQMGSLIDSCTPPE